MDKSAERETRDFMNVESFSQLPFIRPAPPVKETGSSARAIRLFGKEFGGQNNTTDDNHSSEKNKNSQQGEEANKDNNCDSNIETNTRKFECHYCCRNFPTSQALGGHQNAHKRERQHAKRAHLQSAMASDAHVYGLMSNYRSAPSLPMAYNSWNSTSANSRLYNGYHGSYNNNAYHQPHQQQQQPINGSPLALWKIPGAHGSSVFARESSMHHQTPLFSSNYKDNHLKPFSAISNGPSSRVGYGYEQKPSMQDHVSLDLHL